MSTCISKHGEYDDHERDESYICTLCGDLDEGALLALAERVIDVDELARVIGERYGLMGMCDRGCECEDCTDLRRAAAQDLRAHLLGEEK